VNEDTVQVSMLFCRPLNKRTTRTDRLYAKGLMFILMNRFLAQIKAVAPSISWNHCSRMPVGLNQALGNVVQIVYFI
jgi:hypothetical protein